MAKAKASKSQEADLLDGILDAMGDDSGTQLLGSDGLSLKIRGVISTQNAEIDAAIGRGGVPLGRLTILHGKEASGKTTLALQLVAEVQRKGGMAVYIDKEYKLDPDYATKLGVDTSRLIISQPSYLEQVFQLIEGVVIRAAEIRKKRGKRVPILVILDSMNACISKQEYEGSWDQVHIAAPARVFSGKLPKLIPVVSQQDVALVFVSQVRKKIGVMFGDDEEIAGGNAPKFFASLVLHVTRLAAERRDGEKVGNKVRIECKKNQIAPPFKRANCLIEYGKGLDGEQSLLTRGATLGVVECTPGSYYIFDGEKIGHGLDRAAKKLRKNTEWRDKIAKAVRELEPW